VGCGDNDEVNEINNLILAFLNNSQPHFNEHLVDIIQVFRISKDHGTCLNQRSYSYSSKTLR
jgi:hypothetical protein